jgi:hypothetical protein
MARNKMSEVKDAGNVISKSGTYEMEVTNVKVEYVGENDVARVQITLECDEGMLWDKLFMTEKSLGFVKRYFSALGYDIDSLEYETKGGKGKKKDHVTGFYLENEAYTIEELLMDEENEPILVTCKTGPSSYKDPVSGETKKVDNPSQVVSKIEAIEE